MPLVWRALAAVILVLGSAIPAQSVAARAVTPWATELRVATPAYQIDMTGITVPDYGLDTTPGAPALPIWSTLVELPAGGPYQISYQSIGGGPLVQQVEVPAAAVPDLSFVERGGIWDLETAPTVAPTVNRPDPAIYSVDAYYPTSLVFGEEQWQRGRRFLALRVFPFQVNPISGSVYYHPNVRITISVAPGETNGAPIAPHVADLASNPPASVTGALRIRTGERGLYRLTYDDLLTAGVPLTDTDVASFTMWYLGQPVAIEVTGNGNALFEPDEVVVFYAEPYQGRYQTDNVYWFTYGGEPGLRMDTRSVAPTGGEPVVTTITQTVHIERNRIYESTFPLPQDADHWFDNRLSPDIATGVLTATRTYDLILDDPLFAGVTRVRAAFHGGANRPPDPDKSVAIYLNGNLVTTHQWEGMTYTVVDATAPAAWLAAATPQVHLVAAISQLPGIEFYSIAPDWVSVTYPALADAQGDTIYIEAVAEGANQVVVSGFSTPDVQVYDLRSPTQPVRVLSTAAESAGATYTVSFWDADLPNPTYFLSSYSALRAPLAIQPDVPSIWGVSDHEADYIAIVHSSLWDAIDPLLAHRAAEGLRIAKVDVQDIYDEWSYGRRDPEAIRSFLSYAYRCWNSAPCDPPPASPPNPPQYVLLVGDGHYDFTGVSSATLPNLIPPYLAHIDPWWGEIAADNRFVSVDGPGDFLPDMALGRLPATSPAAVSAIVDKILAYETAAPSGQWQERVIFVADNNLDPAGNFHAFSNEIRNNWLPSGYDDRTIFYNLDYTNASLMREAIKNSYNARALMVQWFGHGNIVRWGSVEVFRTPDVANLQANDVWPLTVSYTCLNGYFIYPGSQQHQSIAEVLVHTPQRGAIVALASSGLHVGGSLLVFNRGIVQAIFQHRVERAGLAADAARQYYFANSPSFQELIDTFIYFGDPALKIRLPEPRLADSDLVASRAWAPPGMSVTFTATLTTTASVSTAAQLTLDLPTGLDAPTALGATSSSAVYDPALHQVSWSGMVAPGAAEVITFTSALAAGQQSCGAVTVSGRARDDLAALTLLQASVQRSVPDVNCDGDVDVVDIQLVAARWGAAQGDSLFHPRYDLDGDGAIGVLDITMTATRWQ